MVRQVRVEVLADARKYTRGMQDAQRTTQKFTDHTSRAGGALKAAFATFTAGAVIAGLKSTVNAASSMNETVSKTKVVFGPAAKVVEDFSKRAATSLGLSRQEAMESAATFGNLFVSMKIGAPKAAEMSTKMIQLAGDLASFNNANPQETLEALRSGLVGETEPLRKFGINLNDADLRQKALSMGLVKSTKEVLPPAIKAQASYALILEQSKTAQGDFARTSGGLANQQRILTAKIKDLKASIGSALLPAVLAGVAGFNSFLGVVDRNKTAFGILFGVLGTGAAIIGTLVVATKIHKAVTEGIAAVTKTWEAAQKGLNLVLGATKVQAAAATVATEAQAAATTAAGTAAAGASARMGAAGLLGGLLKLSPLLVTVGVGMEFWREKTDSVTIAANKLVTATDSMIDNAIKNGTVNQAIAQSNAGVAQATKDQGLQTAYAAKQTELQRQAMVDSVPAYQTAADKARLNAGAIKEMSAKLAEARGEMAQNRESMAKTIESYDGLISKSKVTAADVVKDLQHQVANFRTYATDAQTLIRRGVNPAAIRELSEKGPEYVHALATGSNKQLGVYKQAWADRQREIKTSFAKSIDEQYQKLAAQIRNMQKRINELEGKTISVAAQLKLSFSPSFSQKDWAQVKVLTRGARGMLVTQGTGPTADDVPALVSKGETIVSARDSADAGFRAWAKARRIKGYATGGVVGTIGREASDINRLQGKGTGIWMDRGLTKMMGNFTGPGGSADVNSVARWTAAILGRAAEWAAWARRIMFESGGNWSAVNRSDSNWFAGHPSVGGAQVIRGTFAANAGPFRNVGPFLYGVSINPRANSYAGAHYAIGRYGSMAAVDPRIRPIGYDQGGVLAPGLNLMWNGTGRREELVPAAAAGPTVVNIYPAPGMSERRVGQMVVEALEARDRRARKGGRP